MDYADRPIRPPTSRSTVPTVSVVIPTLNEAANLPYVLQGLRGRVDEVVLVDGFSEDDTVAVAKELWPDIRIVFQSERGKGNALACGVAAATGDIVVTIDADGSMDPTEIPALVDALVRSGADYAKGSREMRGGGSDDLTAVRRLGNFALRTVVNLLYRTRFTDLCYGFNAFWRVHRGSLGLGHPDHVGVGGIGSGFEVETCMNIRAARAGLDIIEVPSFESPRISGVSNLHVARDGFRILRAILSERTRPLPLLPGTETAHGNTSSAGVAPDIALTPPFRVGIWS